MLSWVWGSAGPTSGKGMLKTGKTFLEDDLFHIFWAPKGAVHLPHHPLLLGSTITTMLHPYSWSGGDPQTPPILTTVHLAGPSQCSLPERFFNISVPFCILL